MKTKLKKCFSILNSQISSHEGFTLIELLVVVAVIGILAASAIAFTDPLGQMQKVNDAQRKSDLAQIKQGLAIYYQDNGRYPASTADYKIANLAPGSEPVSWGTPWQPFMNVLPKDPSPSKNYIYYSIGAGQAYYIYASLDRGGKDSQTCNNGTVCPNVPSGATCGGICNYGVTSSNVSP